MKIIKSMVFKCITCCTMPKNWLMCFFFSLSFISTVWMAVAHKPLKQSISITWRNAYHYICNMYYVNLYKSLCHLNSNQFYTINIVEIYLKSFNSTIFLLLIFYSISLIRVCSYNFINWLPLQWEKRNCNESVLTK